MHRTTFTQAGSQHATGPTVPAALLTGALDTEQKTRRGEVPQLCSHQASARVHDARSPLSRTPWLHLFFSCNLENNVSKQVKCLRQPDEHLEDNHLAELGLLSHAWHTSAGGALALQHSIYLSQETLIKIILLFEKKQHRQILGNVKLICDTEKSAMKVLRT